MFTSDPPECPGFGEAASSSQVPPPQSHGPGACRDSRLPPPAPGETLGPQGWLRLGTALSPRAWTTVLWCGQPRWAWGLSLAKSRPHWCPLFFRHHPQGCRTLGHYLVSSFPPPLCLVYSFFPPPCLEKLAHGCMCARMCVSSLFIFQTYFSKPNPDACSCCPSRIHPISQIASHSNICKQNMFIFTSSVGSKNEGGKVARAELARGRGRDKANAPALPPSAKQTWLKSGKLSSGER